MEQIKNEIKESMMAAAQAAGAGNCPAEIERIIKQFQNSK